MPTLKKPSFYKKWFLRQKERQALLLSEAHENAYTLRDAMGCSPNLVVLTNLAEGEHLDYYGSQANYLDSATEVLRQVEQTPTGSPGLIVLNRDDRYFQLALEKCSAEARVVTFSIKHPSADVQAKDIIYRLDSLEFTCVTPDGIFPVAVHASGEFGLYNTLASITAAWAMGVPLKTIQVGLTHFTKVTARYQVLSSPQKKGPTVVVDYGHTLPGQKKVFSELKRYQAEAQLTGRLITVYGCQETWDASKRRKMVKLILQNSDHVIFTTNSQVTMSSESLVQQALMGNSAKHFQSEWDRERAIACAIDMATDQDIVVILGRGGENYMHQDQNIYHFNDVEVTRKLLKARGLYAPLKAEEHAIIKGLGRTLSQRVHRILAKICR